MPLGHNRVLGDKNKPEQARPHRIAIATWPTMRDDPRSKTLPALLGHLSTSGYEGLEFAWNGYSRYFPGESPATIVSKARREVEKAGLKNFGATLHLGDEQLRQHGWMPGVEAEMKLVQDLGGDFVSFQYEIAKNYYNTAGAYREDADYLKWCADTVAKLRDKVWSLGMNFYLEVHVDRITEDPAALCRILEMTTCELNGDLSHNLARGYLKGKYIDRINKLVNHTHVRMARTYGDLSADVPDPKADWEAKGITWGMFKCMQPALVGGLSSRTISGESGPMHLVKDTLTLDAKLVPLYRAMARFADASAQGITMKVEEPGDLKPWG